LHVSHILFPLHFAQTLNFGLFKRANTDHGPARLFLRMCVAN